MTETTPTPAPLAPLVTSPAGGVPALTDTDETAMALIPMLAADEGPVAADTERAAGYRYSQRAYLIQLKTESTGIHLLDPTALAPSTMTALNDALSDREWILHAANQDLPCLRDAGFNPHTIFDTEMAARLLGRQRVGLGPLLEDVLDVHLAKDHARSDWSRRPLPEDWLSYAALDVEFLAELRDALARELAEAGKSDWARQEFEHQLTIQPNHIQDPWRRTSEIGAVKTRRGLALVRELWQTREEIAQELDFSPHRVINDRAIAAAASQATEDGFPQAHRILTTGSWTARLPRMYTERWLNAARTVDHMSVKRFPPKRLPAVGPGSPSGWGRKNPEAAARWQTVRPILADLATDLNLPVENLISPKPLRALLWEPIGIDESHINEQLESLDVRPWQRDLVTGVIAEALSSLAANDASPSEV